MNVFIYLPCMISQTQHITKNKKSYWTKEENLFQQDIVFSFRMVSDVIDENHSESIHILYIFYI